MSRYTVKVNVSGSWANMVNCPEHKLDDVKEACQRLAEICGHGIAFKIIDNWERVDAFMFNSKPRSGEPHGWYRPVCNNPVQAGLDRTTSGAIGQP